MVGKLASILLLVITKRMVRKLASILLPGESSMTKDFCTNYQVHDFKAQNEQTFVWGTNPCLENGQTRLQGMDGWIGTRDVGPSCLSLRKYWDHSPWYDLERCCLGTTKAALWRGHLRDLFPDGARSLWPSGSPVVSLESSVGMSPISLKPRVRAQPHATK